MTKIGGAIPFATRPNFKPEQFKPTPWATEHEKASFANWLVEFICGGFHAPEFTKRRYKQLSNLFHHIAHYDRGGFFHEWFRDIHAQVRFVANIRESPPYPDAPHTWADVERAIRRWVDHVGAFEALVVVQTQAVEQQELETLARLKAKYEGG
jgi:hypothetical protein